MDAKPERGEHSALVDGAQSKQEKPPIAVFKPIPYTFDLGNLLCNDTNPVPPRITDSEVAAISRDAAQTLLNQLLTTCNITHSSTEGTLLNLPAPTTPLPREKPLPLEKRETKWERFARKKGIIKKSKNESKLVYDEEKGDWVPKWGYRGRKKDDEGDWIVEVDTKKESELQAGESIRGLGRKERKANVKRNERKRRANERRVRKNGS